MKKWNRWFSERGIEYKKYLVILYVVIIMIPVLIITSLVSQREDMFVRSVAVCLLLILFVSFFVYSSKRQLAKSWGIYSCGTQKQDSGELIEYAKKSDNIQIIAAKDLDKVLSVLETASIELVQSVQIVLLNPQDEKAVSAVESISGMEAGEYGKTVNKIHDFREKFGEKLTICYYDEIPLDTVVILKQFVAVYPITQALQNGKQFSIMYLGSRNGYEHYSSYFNALWARCGEQDAGGEQS